MEARRADAPEDPPSRSLLVRVRKLLGRIRRLFAVDTFDVFTRPVPPEPGFTPPAGYTFRWGTAEDVESCDPFHTDLDEHERRTGVARLELGHKVVIAFHGAEAVFSMWANPRNLNVPGLVKRRLADDQWFVYKAFTSPEHRGRNLYEAGLQFVLDAMREEGLGELVGYAHVKKRVSRKGLARLDFGSAGRLVSLQVPGLQRTFVSRRLAGRFPEPVSRSRILADLDNAPQGT